MLHWSQLKGFSPVKDINERVSACVTLHKVYTINHGMAFSVLYVLSGETHHCGSSRAAGAGTSG